MRGNNPHEIPNLRVSNEGNTNGEFSLHATREGLGASLSLVLKVQDTDDPVYLIWNLLFGVAFQLDIKQRNTPNEPYSHPNTQHLCDTDASHRAEELLCEYLCIEEQVLPDSKVIKEYIMLGTESQAAADQSHVLTDVVPIDISPATGGGKQPCRHKHKENKVS